MLHKDCRTLYFYVCYWHNKFISESNFSFEMAVLPFLSFLFRICKAGDSEERDMSRRMACCEKGFKMSSI